MKQGAGAMPQERQKLEKLPVMISTAKCHKYCMQLKNVYNTIVCKGEIFF